MRKQKFLSVLMALAMTLSILTPAAYAAEPESTEQSVQVMGSTPQDASTESSNKSDKVALSTDETSDETEPADESENTSTESVIEPETPTEAANEESPVVEPETPEDAEGIGEEETTISPATDYYTFLSSLKVLESYASDYALANGGDGVGLVLNYIRTGIEKYNTDSWATLAGAENTSFVTYVAEQDTAKGTTAQAVRGIGTFVAPDGTMVEFPHMFATMDLTYYNSKATSTLDYGGWAGDIVDLMEYTNGKLTATEVEAMT